jgi:F0F1-type ATP synthase assembly protein I
VIVGSVAGYYIDKWLGTLPIFFIICFFLGVAGSALNIYRSVQRDNNKDS